MVKWIFLVIVAVIGYMIYTGNMGGAKEATGNYVKVRHTQSEEGAAEARPNLIHQMIEYNKNK
ncbi:MAG: hypothetical protein U9O56_04840 [Campylobacterota bacterium]|nr:hypothetical protein [Campylobacterota bacterium]